MTTTVTLEEGQAAVFIAYDHCSGECVGIHASGGQNRWEAVEPIRQGVKDYFGTARENIAENLSLQHDYGTQYMAHDFQKEIKWLGITSSPAFVRMPKCNGCDERYIRTLKENLLWVRHFKTIEEVRLALMEFRQFSTKYGSCTDTSTKRPRSSEGILSTNAQWLHKHYHVSHNSRALHCLQRTYHFD